MSIIDIFITIAQSLVSGEQLLRALTYCYYAFEVCTLNILLVYAEIMNNVKKWHFCDDVSLPRRLI